MVFPFPSSGKPRSCGKITLRAVVTLFRHFGTTYRSRNVGKELPL